MNISIKDTLAISNISQLNPQPDVNYQNKISFDKFTFDSLINNFRSDPAAPALERSDYHAEVYDRGPGRRPEEITTRQEQSGRNNNINEERFNDRPDEITRRPDESEISAETENDGYCSGGIDVTKDQQEKPVETVDQTGGNGTVAAENNSETAVSEDTEVNSENGLKAGAFLYAMASSVAEGLNNNNETSVSDGKAATDGEGAQNGMKTGALLFDMAARTANEGETTVNAGTEAGLKSENGLKAGILLKEIMKSNGSAESQTAQVTDTENTDALNTDQMKSDKGLKAGELLLDKAKSSINEKPVDEGLVNSQIKAADSKADGTKDAAKDLPKLSGNNELKQNILNEFKIQGETAEAELTEENNNARTLTGRTMSEFAGNFQRHGGSRNFGDNSSKTVRVNNENSNTIQGNASVTTDSGKVSEGLQAARAARPSAFQEIADKITYTMKGSSRIGVTIENEIFGKLNMNLSMNKGLVNIHINAADSVMKELVENNINNIIESLSKNGVSVGGFSVGLRNHRNHEGSGDGDQNRNRNDFSIEKGTEYLEAGRRSLVSDSLVSIFA